MQEALNLIQVAEVQADIEQIMEALLLQPLGVLHTILLYERGVQFLPVKEEDKEQVQHLTL